MDAISNRELASLIWFLIGTTLLPLTETFRNFFTSVLCEVIRPKIASIFILSAFYIVFASWLVIPEQYDSLRFYFVFPMWFLFGALPSIWAAVSDANETKFGRLRNWVKTAFSVTSILTFISNFKSFSLVAELFILPIFLVLTLFIIQQRDSRLHRFANVVLATAGLILILHSAYAIYIRTDTFLVSDNLANLYIPPTLSLLFVPFLYVLYLVVCYENAFSTVNRYVNDMKLARYTKSSAFLSFACDITALRDWVRCIPSNIPTSKKEVQITLSVIYRKIQRARYWRKKRLYGWEISKAQDYLGDYGFKFNRYQSSLHDSTLWISMSNVIDIESANHLAIPNTISYNLEGDEFEIQKLKLILKVNIPTEAELAETIFRESAETLVSKALPRIASQEVIKHIDMDLDFDTNFEHVKISLDRLGGDSEKSDRYALNLTITLV